MLLRTEQLPSVLPCARCVARAPIASGRFPRTGTREQEDTWKGRTMLLHGLCLGTVALKSVPVDQDVKSNTENARKSTESTPNFQVGKPFRKWHRRQNSQCTAEPACAVSRGHRMSQAQDPPGFAGAPWALGGPWAPASPTWLRELAEIQTLHLVPPFAPLPFGDQRRPQCSQG